VLIVALFNPSPEAGMIDWVAEGSADVPVA
jgi:hypothetical protein